MASERKEIAARCKEATLAAVESLGGRASRAAIRERALRDGGFTEAQLAVAGPASKPRYPRLADYYLSWSLTWLKKDGVLVSEGASMWALSPARPPAEPILIDVAARHEELMRSRRRRWPWSKAA